MALVGKESVPQQRVMRKGPTDVEISVDLCSPWVPQDEIIETFEFNHELAWRFWVDQKWAELCPIVCIPLVWPELYFLRQNAADAAYNRWLAVSKENIFVVRKHRKAQCRFHCQDVGAIRKMIPIANVQDVMIEEPAGTACCCFVPNVLSKVVLQTAAASHGEDPHGNASMACLVGLEDPQRFREVIIGLKRGTFAGTDGSDLNFAVPQADGLGAPVRPNATTQMQQTLDQILQTLKSMDAKMETQSLLPGSVPTGS